MLDEQYTLRVSSLHPRNHESFHQNTTDGIIIIQKGLTVSRPKKKTR